MTSMVTHKINRQQRALVLSIVLASGSAGYVSHHPKLSWHSCAVCMNLPKTEFILFHFAGVVHEVLKEFGKGHKLFKAGFMLKHEHFFNAEHRAASISIHT